MSNREVGLFSQTVLRLSKKSNGKLAPIGKILHWSPAHLAFFIQKVEESEAAGRAHYLNTENVGRNKFMGATGPAAGKLGLQRAPWHLQVVRE
jgi:hypothetical protein